MKLILFIILHTAIGLFVYAQETKTEVQYFNIKPKKVQTSTSLKKVGEEWVRDGECKEYFYSGGLKTSSNYVNGVLTGKSIIYTENNTKVEERNYSDNDSYSFVIFYANGEIQCEGRFANKTTTISKYGFPNGNYALMSHQADSTNIEIHYKTGGKLLINNIVDLRKYCTGTRHWEYPISCQELGLSGLVIVSFRLNAKGIPSEIKPIEYFNEDALTTDLE
jgi:antitoxin component YwqK of YwqJK toxin-antitoxin module